MNHDIVHVLRAYQQFPPINLTNQKKISLIAAAGRIPHALVDADFQAVQRMQAWRPAAMTGGGALGRFWITGEIYSD